jgi:hypothetical protein
MNATFRLTLLGGLVLLGPAGTTRAEEAAGHRAAVQKGLHWLAGQQHKDGHWEANGGQYPVALTGLAGVALLMEGSTLREGKHQDNIRRAVDWLLRQTQPNGLIGNPNNPGEGGRYMYGHGYATLFLACVHGEEEDRDRRRQLEDVLTRASQFTRGAQTHGVSSRDRKTPVGGWGYVSAKDGNNFDEGSVTVTQLQALCACRRANIKVPPRTIEEGLAYLEEATAAEGGIRYSLTCAANGRPALTAAALVCAGCAGKTNTPAFKRWLKFCRIHIPAPGSTRSGYDEYTHYYHAQAVYRLGEDGYGKLFPESPAEERLTWSKHRRATFDHLVKTQAVDGSWPSQAVGAVYATSVYLTILQLDNATLPLYQRR